MVSFALRGIYGLGAPAGLAVQVHKAFSLPLTPEAMVDDPLNVAKEVETVWLIPALAVGPALELSQGKVLHKVPAGESTHILPVVLTTADVLNKLMYVK